MSSNFLKIIIFGLILVWNSQACPAATAAVLTLDSGEQIRGQIIEQTDTYVMLDVQGMPETFYLAEIASINGKDIEMPQAKAAVTAPAAVVTPSAKVERPVVPSYGDEEDSLIRFMNVRKNTPSTPA